MNSTDNPVSVFTDSKNHYEILDGLRGVAAVMVVLFHLFETFTGGNHLIQIINHGYLAVDFFFVLSGFVIGYAYDNRWAKMTLGGFFKRRLIRLHPMIILGMLIGAIGFYFSASPIVFPAVSTYPVWKMLLVMFIGFTLIPLPGSMDVRGWSQMHPLNGPAWSLFYEYVANILYGLLIRKWSTKVLVIFTILAGCALIHLGVTSPYGDVVGGWSIDTQFRIGITRLLYPFLAGLLLSRISKPGTMKHAFFWCSALIIASLSIPRIGGTSHVWMNGLYDSVTILVVFPLIVYMGASGAAKGKFTRKIAKFFGDISYPLYITHYPLLYIFTAWIYDNQVSMQKAWFMALIVLFSSVAIAYGSLKVYDIPVRNWLAKRFMTKTLEK